MLKPIYVRHVLEGLAMEANNRPKFEWAGVLILITAAVARHDEPIDPATLFDGDDRDWRWAGVKAAELLAAGLRHGAEGIGFEHAAEVRSIVGTIPIFNYSTHSFLASHLDGIVSIWDTQQ